MIMSDHGIMTCIFSGIFLRGCKHLHLAYSKSIGFIVFKSIRIIALETFIFWSELSIHFLMESSLGSGQAGKMEVSAMSYHDKSMLL